MINKFESVGDNINATRASWNFHGETALNIDDHVSKSVPGYTEGHEIILSLSDYFVTKNNSYIVDVGSSTGMLIKRLSERHSNKNLNFIGIDSVKEMCQIAKQKNTNSSHNIDFECIDFLNFEFKKPISMFVSYYTMQFINTSIRQKFIDKIYNSLEWGGAFFLFEKIRSPDARFQDYMTQVYNDFKLRNGYTIEEINKKSESIRGILEPFSEQGNIDLFKRAGFKDFTTIYHNICFRGWLLIK